MKAYTANLSDLTTTISDLASIRNILGEFDATLESKEYRMGDRGIELRKCSIHFDPQLAINLRHEPIDAEKKWLKILDICRQRGFSVLFEKDSPTLPLW
jgi:hypothetical protein